MVSIRLVNVSNYVLRNINLEIPDRSVLTIVGPNGAGKTTLLRVIAGLTQYSGNVYFDNKSVDNIPPWSRRIGYLPQSIALFPHMTVLDNVLIGLRARGISLNIAIEKAREYMELLGIYELRDRYPHSLSGGEKKKVALARILAIEPEILLLDEPFAGLHPDQRLNLLTILQNYVRRGRVTTIIVSHEIDEAIKMSTHYALMINGHVLYSGGLKGFIESMGKYMNYLNVLECKPVSLLAKGLLLTECNELELVVPSIDPSYFRNRILVSIPSDHVVVHEKPCSRTNCFEGIVTSVREGYVHILIGNTELKAVANGLSPGSSVYVELPISSLRVYSIE
ncbi:MAG: ATP-binding cassette domain-containing protein [Thermoprotei archaeon]